MLTLYYLREMSYEDIGEVMTLPMGTVKTHLHRAKQALGQWEAIRGSHVPAGRVD